MSKEQTTNAMHQFQVRLPPDVAEELQHFMESRNYTASKAIRLIISRFFKGK
jgi:predicted transcriptional regulator